MQLSASESLIEVCKDILDAFGTDRKSYSVGLDTLIKKLFLGKLGMSCTCGVDNKGLNICNVCKEREYLKSVDKLLSLLSSALYLKGEDRACAVGEIFLIKSVVGVVGKCGVIYAFNSGVIFKELNDLKSILNVTLNSERKCLKSLKEQECIEGRNSRTCIYETCK